MLNGIIKLKHSTMHKFILPALALALCLTAFSPVARAQNLSGFSPGNAKRQAGIEARLLTLPQPAAYRQHLETLTREPHLAGSPENRRVAEYLAQSMAAAGLRVERFPYDLYMPTSIGEVKVELVTPLRMPLNIYEDIVPEDPFSADPRIGHGWNAYAGSGDVTAEVVYANYGRKEDFEKLEAMGVSLKGKIAIARYGGNFRGYKAKYAEAAGAIGLIIYTDPEDSGYKKGLMYPEGTYYNASTIQRGSTLTLDYSGDPLTPFQPALPMDGKDKTARLQPSEVAFHTIPVTPLPFGAAQEILSRMKGAAVPSGWQGGLPFPYRIQGDATLRVRLKVEQPRGFVRAENIVGTLEGSEFPDEWIILGCHYDAWNHGAADPNSGTAMLLSLAEALGQLAKDGYRPRRSIKIAHWDAEEYGILGSTEWVEQFRTELNTKAVAYFNADAACSGLNFSGAASPSLKALLMAATQDVPYLDTDKSVYEHWRGVKAKPGEEPAVGNLGGGSDHLPFYAHAGIPSLSAGTGGPSLYHSAYDNFHWYKTFADPNFVAGPMVAKVFGIMTLRMANADLLPYHATRYGIDLQKHLKAVAEGIGEYDATFSLAPLPDIAAEIAQNGKNYHETAEAVLRSGALPTEKLRDINQQLISLERSFLDAQGMAYGSWYRSLYASSDPYSGYASWMLPGFLYEISTRNSQRLPEWTARYKRALEELNTKIIKLSAQVNH